MNLPPPVVNFCRANGYGEIRNSHALGGGCINNASQLDTEAGPLFLKVNPSTPPDMFEREAEGLAALAAPKAIRVPAVLCAAPNFILQEFIDPGPRRANFWETFGLQMAALHNCVSPQFGFAHNNYIGPTPQVNDWEENGFNFFVRHRLGYQVKLAAHNGYFDSTDRRQAEALIARLPDLIPPQPASLIHGDLWSGNILSGPQGEPVLIDPAVHYGWAEAELAMMTLFGSVPSAFFGAYESVRPLAPGYKERFDLYNLYHLLNHLNLFGESYAGSVRAILRRYA